MDGVSMISTRCFPWCAARSGNARPVVDSPVQPCARQAARLARLIFNAVVMLSSYAPQGRCTYARGLYGASAGTRTPTATTCWPPLTRVRWPLVPMSSRRMTSPAQRVRSVPLPSVMVSEPASMKNHCRYGEGCHGPDQSPAKRTTTNPVAGRNSDASSGVVGGAKLRVPSGSVQASKCERPVLST